MTIAPKLSRQLKTVLGKPFIDLVNMVNAQDVLSSAEAAFIDGVTAGTQAASKAMVLDANQELSGLGRIRVTDTIIATAAVLALNATPITVVAAPGVGVFTEFLGAYVLLDYNAAAYVDGAGEDLVFKYTDSSGAEVSIEADGSLFDGTADACVWIPPIGAAAAVGAVEMVDNAVIVLHLLSGEWITGDSPLKVRVYHRQVRLASMVAIA